MRNTGMTVKERMLAAIRCEDTDYVPLSVDFGNPYARDDASFAPHARAHWNNERERLTAYREWGLDTYLTVLPVVTPTPAVETSVAYSAVGGEERITQLWKTPAGTIREELRLTPDWAEAYGRTANIPFGSDFRTARYADWPFRDSGDFAALDYLFPEQNSADDDTMRREYDEKKALSDEFHVPLFVYLDAGMDWLMWLFPPEEAVFAMSDEPERISSLLTRINAAKRKRLETLLSWGVDGVYRRGWYESTDFWSPDLFRAYAAPELKREIAMAHESGAVFTYLMMTGIMPLLDDLSALPFDCLVGAEPSYGQQDLAVIRNALPGKSIWGGISGPDHLERGTPESVRAAVERAFAVLGKRGFILSPAVIFRRAWPWENFTALKAIWKEYR